MKKIISLILTLTIVVAMLVPMLVVPTAAMDNQLLSTYEAAKDGDKLISLLFGEPGGAYEPYVFANFDNEEDIHEGVRYHCTPVITITEDKKSFNMFYDDQGEEGDNFGTLLYGGKIDGLKWGYDVAGNPYQYTFTFQALFDHEESNNRQSGFYFCMGSDLTTRTDEDGRTITHITGSETGHLGAYGWWGHPCNSVYKNPMRWHRIDRDGCSDLNLDGAISTDMVVGLMMGELEWYNVCVQIDGYKMQISFNGWKLGLGEGQEEVFYDFSDSVSKDGANSYDLAFIGRLYNETMNLSLKDVNVYKGIGLDLPGYTDPPETLYPEDETDAPADDATDAPAGDATDAPADDATDAPADDATDAPAADATDAPAGDATDAPADDAGCASVATASIALIAVLGTAIVFKKRH